MKVVVHDKPDARATWATHGTDGFYVGPAMQHCRCWRCHMPETRAIRITDTIAWLPLGHTMPGHSQLEAFTAAVTDLATAVRHMTSADKHLAMGSPAADRLSITVQALQVFRSTVDITAPPTSALEPVERVSPPPAPVAVERVPPPPAPVAVERVTVDTTTPRQEAPHTPMPVLPTTHNTPSRTKKMGMNASRLLQRCDYITSNARKRKRAVKWQELTPALTPLNRRWELLQPP
jgi:hypothetical protein